MAKNRSTWVKVISLSLLAVLLFTGCVTGNPSSRQATATPSASGTSSSGAQLPVTGEGNPSQPMMLLETGSSLIYPLFNQWAQAIHGAYPNITVQTASTGSGTGISQAIAGVVQIGASDAYMSDAQLSRAPGLLNIAVAISAQQINYNLAGVKNLNLSGTVLAGIYTGKITYWDDAAIKADNPGASLPHHKIVPLHRNEGSGDTFLFTSYLSDTDQNWKNNVGANTLVSWPSVAGGLGAQGNQGMVQALAQTPDSIGYVGISFMDQAVSQGLGTASLKNQAGKFVQPTQENISAAAGAMVSKTPDDERISLIYAPGANSYPIINYEYLIVQSNQTDPVMAGALRTALLWIIAPDGGNGTKFLNTVHFLPLPASIVAKSKAQINKIHS